MADTIGKVIKCRAAIAWELNKPLSIEEIEVEPPQDHEVRVRIVATGLCHSDASLMNGVIKLSNMFPTIPGHEASGIVESVGEKVTKFKAGDRVIPLYAGQCSDCEYCHSSKTNLCLTNQKIQTTCGLKGDVTRIKCKGKKIHQFMSLGTFAEYIVVEDLCLAKIHHNAPLEEVCILGCGVATGYGAAINTAKVEPGSSCAVWGLGGIGLAAVMGCRKAGASKIYGIDINPDKFEMAKKLGCTDCINPNDYKGENFAKVLQKLVNGGFDYTFECIGLLQTMRTAIDASHPAWGKTTLIGIANMDKDLNIFPFDLIGGRKIGGTFFGGYQGVKDVPKLVEEYMNKELLIDDFITHRMKLEDINKGFDLMKDGKSIRTILIL